MEKEEEKRELNDELTIEGMLQVVDTKTGKAMDVRQMLGIKSEDIKDEKLREKISNYSIIDSQFMSPEERKRIAERENEILNMGEYFSKLDTLEFDMGKFEDEGEESKEGGSQRKSSNWKDWWEIKLMQNEKLKDAIIANDHAKVKKLLESEDLLAQGYQADVNFVFDFNRFRLSPLLLAI